MDEFGGRSLESEELSRTPRPVRRLAALWLGFAAVGALFAFVPWTQSTVGQGVVTVLSPMMRPQTVSAGFDGRLIGWRVREGDRVAEGQVLAELGELRPEFLDPRQLERARGQTRAAVLKRSAAEAQLRSYDRLIAALRQVARARLPSDRLRRVEAAELDESGRRLLEAERQAVLAARLNLERVQRLHAEGLRPTRDVEVAQRELAKAEGDVEAKLLETELKRAQLVERLASLESDLIKTEGDVSRLSERRDQRLVRSPIHGQVVRLFGAGAGHAFKAGDPVAVVAPDTTDLAVELMIPDHDAPLVSPGLPARVQFAGWPALQISGWPAASVGTFAGVVSAVEASSDERGRFRILVAPDEEAIAAGRENAWPKPPSLRVGTQAVGWVILNRVPIWYELWRRFNAFPAEVPEPPASGKK